MSLEDSSQNKTSDPNAPAPSYFSTRQSPTNSQISMQYATVNDKDDPNHGGNDVNSFSNSTPSGTFKTRFSADSSYETTNPEEKPKFAIRHGLGCKSPKALDARHRHKRDDRGRAAQLSQPLLDGLGATSEVHLTPSYTKWCPKCSIICCEAP